MPLFHQSFIKKIIGASNIRKQYETKMEVVLTREVKSPVLTYALQSVNPEDLIM